MKKLRKMLSVWMCFMMMLANLSVPVYALDDVNIIESDLIVAAEEVYTIESGKTLSVSDTHILTNEGTIINNGTLVLGSEENLVNNGIIINYGKVAINGIEHECSYKVIDNQDGKTHALICEHEVCPSVLKKCEHSIPHVLGVDGDCTKCGAQFCVKVQDVTVEGSNTLTYGYDEAPSVSVDYVSDYGITYQWYEKLNDADYVAIDGATERIYNFPQGKTVGTYYLYSKVTCNGISFNSNEAEILVEQATTGLNVELDKNIFTYGEDITGVITMTPEMNEVNIYQLKDGEYDKDAPLATISNADDTTFTIDAISLGVGDYEFIAVFEGNENMTATTSTFVVNIEAKDINNIKVDENIVVEYNGQEQKPTVQLMDEQLAYYLVEGFDYIIEYSNNVDAGEANYTLTGKGNYTGTKECTFKITPAPVAVLDASVKLEKEYDGNTIAEIIDFGSIYGLVEGDEVVVSSGKANYKTANVGNTIEVVFSDFELGGKDAGNYSISQLPYNTLAAINKKEVTPVIKVEDKQYDGKDSAIISKVELPGVVEGDVVTLQQGTATFATTFVGENIALILNGFVVEGEDSENYELRLPEVTANIYNNFNAENEKEYTLSHTGWSNQDLVVTAKNGYEVSLTNTVDGTWSDSLSGSEEGETTELTFYIKNVETGAISLEETIVYKLDKTAPTGTISIEDSKWYELLNKIAFDKFFKDTKVVEIEANDTLSGVKNIEYYISNNEVTDVTSITEWQPYNTVTISDNNKYIVYAKITDHAGNVTYISTTGLVKYEVPTNTTVSVTVGLLKDTPVSINFKGNVVKSVKNGESELAKEDYEIGTNCIVLKKEYLKTLKADVYDLTIEYAPMGVETEVVEVKNTIQLTVNRGQGQATVKTEDWTYGENASTVVVESDTYDVATAEYRYESTDGNGYNNTVPPTNAGEYRVVVTLPQNDFYNGCVVSETFVINTRALNILEITIKDKIYDGNTDATVGEITTDALSTDIINVTINKATYDTKDVYNFKVVSVNKDDVVITGDDASNYHLDNLPDVIYGDINQRPITIIPDANQTKVYGTDEPTFTYTVGGEYGLVKDETLEGNISRVEGENVGHYEYSLYDFSYHTTNRYNRNYIMTLDETNKFEITKATLVITAENKKVAEGVALPTFTYAQTGLVDGDIITKDPTLLCDTTNSSVLGNYKIIAKDVEINDGNGNQNYEIQYVDGTLTVYNIWDPVIEQEYTVNSKDWINTEFVVTATEGHILSTDKTNWSETLKGITEGDNNTLSFYVKDTETGAISLQETVSYKLDKTKPMVKVTYDKQVDNDCYNGTRTATIEITERYFDASQVKVIGTVDGKVDNYPLLSEWTSVGDVHTATITFAKDGHYTFDIEYADKAGNAIDDYQEDTFYVDLVAPTLEFAFEGLGKAEAVVSKEDYGYFFAEDTKVTITVSDAQPSSGLNKVYYRIIDYKGVETKKEAVIQDGKIEFIVPKGFKGQVYAYALDQAQNASQETNPNGVVIENGESEESQHENHSNATITTNDATIYKDIDGLPLYTKDVTYKLTVKDLYSGLAKLVYKVNGIENTTVIPVNLDKKVKAGSVINGWTVVSMDNNLVTAVEKEIVVSEDKNGNTVELVGYDRVGHTITTDITKVSIDKTKPTAEISWNAVEDDKEFKGYYKENRVATIIVNEHNFDANKVKVVVTKDDEETQPTLTWASEGDVHKATIEFAEDADYVLSIQSLHDLAMNEFEPIKEHAFTLDKTKPTVEVSYNNNTAKNGNYYNKPRTATIVINEHNFDISRINVFGTAADDGKVIKFPVVSEWTSEGDVHKATIAYTADGYYTFDIEYTDKAGNSIENYKEHSFYIDTIAPSIKITGVANKSANNGSVVPVISYSDTNFDENKVSIIYKGTNRGELAVNGEKTKQKNGEVVTISNLANKKENDDLYTIIVNLTDKAGNKSSKTVTYSINRFGSVYTFDSLLEARNLKYSKEEFDVVFTETNVNALEDIEMQLSKNGVVIKLVKDVDYTIQNERINDGWYQYQYLVNKNLFRDNAKYSLQVTSKDAAGNVNTNVSENKSSVIEFGIDKEAPSIVPVNVESDTTYAEVSKNVEISINDNLVLSDVQVEVNGVLVEYTEDENGIYSFTLDEMSKAQSIRILAIDAAGNVTEQNLDGIYVSTNMFVRWYTNTPLFVVTLFGISATAFGSIFVILKKKKEEEEASIE